MEEYHKLLTEKLQGEPKKLTEILVYERDEGLEAQAGKEVGLLDKKGSYLPSGAKLAFYVDSKKVPACLMSPVIIHGAGRS